MNRTALLLASLGGLLLIFTACGLLLNLPLADAPHRPKQIETMVALLATEGLVYFVAVYVVLHHKSSRYAAPFVVFIAIALRVPLIFNHPVLSSDIYRYIWDGQVQSAGINPYRYIPTDPALDGLRDPAVFPLVNRSSYARTIYPPAAQVIFAFVGRVTTTVTGMKIAMVAFEVLACLCMLRLLAMAKLPPERLLIYAWNPLAQWSFASDGHVDAAAIGLLALALLCRAKPRYGAAGAILAAATLIKFLPLVVAPAFVRGGRFWRPAIMGAGTIALLYTLYVSAGAHVLGFLQGYTAEEGLDDGHGIWLLAGLSNLIKLPPAASILYFLCAIGGFAALSIWIARQQQPRGQNEVVTLCRDTAVLAACTMIVISPHYPWYFAWLALPSVVAPAAGVIWLSMAPIILYLNPWHEQFFWASFVYLPALALTGFSFWRSRNIPQAAVERSPQCKLQPL